MHVSMIAAVSDDGFIAAGGGIPWHLPRDVRRFREYTADKWLLLGRATYQEMDGWFTGHRPLVLTRRERFRPAVGRAVQSVEEALRIAEAGGAEELVVCGGGQTYQAALPWARALILTRVHTKLAAGVPFPEFSQDDWTEKERQHFPADREHVHAMTFLHLRRIPSPQSPITR